MSAPSSTQKPATRAESLACGKQSWCIAAVLSGADRGEQQPFGWHHARGRPHGFGGGLVRIRPVPGSVEVVADAVHVRVRVRAIAPRGGAEGDRHAAATVSRQGARPAGVTRATTITVRCSAIGAPTTGFGGGDPPAPTVRVAARQAEVRRAAQRPPCQTAGFATARAGLGAPDASDELTPDRFKRRCLIEPGLPLPPGDEPRSVCVFS